MCILIILLFFLLYAWFASSQHLLFFAFLAAMANNAVPAADSGAESALSKGFKMRTVIFCIFHDLFCEQAIFSLKNDRKAFAMREAEDAVRLTLWHSYCGCPVEAMPENFAMNVWDMSVCSVLVCLIFFFDRTIGTRC